MRQHTVPIFYECGRKRPLNESYSVSRKFDICDYCDCQVSLVFRIAQFLYVIVDVILGDLGVLHCPQCLPGIVFKVLTKIARISFIGA